jgi:hypothetical protein
MLHQRILMQKMITNAGRFPADPHMKAFESHSAKLSLSLQSNKRALKKHIKDLSSLQKQMFKLAGTRVNFDYPSTDDNSAFEEESTDALWKSIDANFSKCLPFIESTVDRWN